MRTLAIVLTLVVAAGCKGKPKDQPATTGSAAVGSGSGSAAATPAAAEPADGAITLPKSSGKPPKKSAGPIDPAMGDKLAALEFPGFNRDPRAKSEKLFEIRYKTATPPQLTLAIRVTPCATCLPMELDKWQPETDKLKLQVNETLRKQPDTTFELGATELNGQPLIYTYLFGHFFGKDEVGNQTGLYSNAYTLHFNDGVNAIEVTARYSDGPVTREVLAKLAPREDLEKLAKAFLDQFTQTW